MSASANPLASRGEQLPHMPRRELASLGATLAK